MSYKWDEMTVEERNALVAEKVMEYQPFMSDYNERMNGYFYNDLTSMPVLAPSFTNDMSSAWKIVEKLDYAFEIVSVSDGIMCTFQWPDENKYPRHKSVKATSESAPEAICKAALKAVGIEIE